MHPKTPKTLTGDIYNGIGHKGGSLKPTDDTAARGQPSHVDVNAIEVLHEDLGLVLAELVHLWAHRNSLVEDAVGLLEQLVQHLQDIIYEGRWPSKLPCTETICAALRCSGSVTDNMQDPCMHRSHSCPVG